MPKKPMDGDQDEPASLSHLTDFGDAASSGYKSLADMPSKAEAEAMRAKNYQPPKPIVQMDSPEFKRRLAKRIKERKAME